MRRRCLRAASTLRRNESSYGRPRHGKNIAHGASYLVTGSGLDIDDLEFFTMGSLIVAERERERLPAKDSFLSDKKAIKKKSSQRATRVLESPLVDCFVGTVNDRRCE